RAQARLVDDEVAVAEIPVHDRLRNRVRAVLGEPAQRDLHRGQRFAELVVGGAQLVERVPAGQVGDVGDRYRVDAGQRPAQLGRQRATGTGVARFAQQAPRDRLAVDVLGDQ